MNEQIRGRVVDDAGYTVAEATVFVLHGPGPVPDIAALTDAEGRFVFDVLEPGTYRLRAEDPSGNGGEADVTVPQEDIIRLSGPELEPGHTVPG